MHIHDGPIAALATSLGTSALAVIRISGKGIFDLVAASCSRPGALRSAADKSFLVMDFLDAQGRRLDEIVCLKWVGPHSYTGEDMLEFSVHGNPLGIAAILARLEELGVCAAQGGEFTLRAFLNGRIDLSQAEAVHEVIQTTTREAHALALSHLNKNLFRLIDALKRKLLGFSALLAVQIDYAEDEVDEIALPLGEVEEVKRELRNLSSLWQQSAPLRKGLRVALAGRTNAGKSSIFNVLVREERAIVSSVHGTTRDYLEAPFSLGGLHIRLFDTAGLRESSDEIEREGMRRTGDVIEAADLVVYVIDGREGARAEDFEHIASISSRKIVVWNKSDSAECLPVVQIPGAPPCKRFSSVTAEGLSELLDAVHDALKVQESGEGMTSLLGSERQNRLILDALAALDRVTEALSDGTSFDIVAFELKEAMDLLGEITGEVSSEDLLDEVFSRFCVGK